MPRGRKPSDYSLSRSIDWSQFGYSRVPPPNERGKITNLPEDINSLFRVDDPYLLSWFYSHCDPELLKILLVSYHPPVSHRAIIRHYLREQGIDPKSIREDSVFDCFYPYPHRVAYVGPKFRAEDKEEDVELPPDSPLRQYLMEKASKMTRSELVLWISRVKTPYIKKVLEQCLNDMGETVDLSEFNYPEIGD